jgi:hypothetical protein
MGAAAVRNQLKSFIPTVTGFAAKTEIYNPYDALEENNDANTRNGWALRVGTSSPADIDLVNAFTEARSFTIVLSRELIRQQDSRTAIDALENEMLTDLDNLNAALLDGTRAGAPDLIAKIDYSGDTGIEYISTKKTFKLMYLEVTYTIEIITDLC